MLTTSQELEVLRLHADGLSNVHIANAVGCGPGPVETTLRRGMTLDEYRRQEPAKTCVGEQGEYLPDVVEIEREKNRLFREHLARKQAGADDTTRPPIYEKPRVPCASLTQRLPRE